MVERVAVEAGEALHVLLIGHLVTKVIIHGDAICSERTRVQTCWRRWEASVVPRNRVSRRNPRTKGGLAAKDGVVYDDAVNAGVSIGVFQLFFEPRFDSRNRD